MHRVRVLGVHALVVDGELWAVQQAAALGVLCLWGGTQKPQCGAYAIGEKSNGGTTARTAYSTANRVDQWSTRVGLNQGEGDGEGFWGFISEEECPAREDQGVVGGNRKPFDFVCNQPRVTNSCSALNRNPS